MGDYLECNKCGELYPKDYDYCPYCKQKEDDDNDYGEYLSKHG
jgi:RNA polymerase subunit RPABC4/transcription elongation factor Spt4